MTITAAKLQAEVGADTKAFDRGMDHADSRVGASGAKWGKALKVGVGAGLAVAGVAITRGVFGAMNAGVTSLRELGVVTAQTNAVIRSTAGAANVSAAGVRDLSTALEAKSGFDDKAIQTGANLLLTFTNIKNEAGAGNDIFDQSVGIMTNMARALGTDAAGGAVQLGIALNDPITGIGRLKRAGVTFDDQQKKQIATMVKAGDTMGAQKIILAELNKEFGESNAEFMKTDAGKAAAFQDSIEGIQQLLASGMLPAITRVQGALTKFLSDPATMGQAQALGDSIAGIFSEGNLKTAAGAMTTAANAIGGAIHLFSSLPPEVQALAVGALALKKITGIGPLDIVKGGTGILKMVFEKGGSPANPLFVSAVGGALGGAGAAGATGAWSKVGTIIGGAFAIVAVAEIANAVHSAISPGGGLENRTNTDTLLPADQLQWPLGPKNTPRWVIDSPFGPLNILGGDSEFPVTPPSSGKPGLTGGPSLEERDEKRAGVTAGIMERAVAAGYKPTAAAVQATFERNAIRTADAQARVVAAALATQRAEEKTTLAIQDTTAAVRALPGGIRNALGGLMFGGRAPGKDKDDLVVPTPRRPRVNATGGPDDRGQIVNYIKVPGATAYDQVIRDVKRWGPHMPNNPRRQFT